MHQHFYNGFIKRAQQYGLTVVEAAKLYKTAGDPRYGDPKYSHPQESIALGRRSPRMDEYEERHAFNPKTPQGAINTAPVEVKTIIDPRETRYIVPGHRADPGSRQFVPEHEQFLRSYYGDNFSEAVRRNNGNSQFSGGVAVENHAINSELGRQQRLLRETNYPTSFNVNSRNPSTGTQHSYSVALGPNVIDSGRHPMVSSVITDNQTGTMHGQNWYQSTGRGSDRRTQGMIVPTNGIYTPDLDLRRTPDALALERHGGKIPTEDSLKWRSPQAGSWIGKFFLDPETNAVGYHEKLDLPFQQATIGKGIKEYFRKFHLGRMRGGIAGPIVAGLAAGAVANRTANAATSGLPNNGPSGNLPQGPPKQFPNVGTAGTGLHSGVDTVIGSGSESAPNNPDSSASPRLPMPAGPRLTVPNVGKK
jgi:hypothetical protein